MFIAVDGIDGAGKTTLVRELARLLAPIDPVVTKEPTGTSPWSEQIKSAVTDERLPHDIELECFHKDRIFHLETLIKPSLEKNKLVITDRYVDSTLAFQANSVDEANTMYTRFLPEILVPDLTIILTCPVKLGLERIEKTRKNFTKFETVADLERAKEIYESRSGPNYELVDSSGAIENTLEQVLALVSRRFPELVPIIDRSLSDLGNPTESGSELRQYA